MLFVLCSLQKKEREWRTAQRKTSLSILSNPILALLQQEHEQALSYLTCEERTVRNAAAHSPLASRTPRIDGSRIHVTCSPLLGGELLCAPKQLRHYHSPDDLSWDEWRLSDSEVERIDLENAASTEEADELDGMTADEMAVDGYYVVAGIARHEYKQGWKFLTLWDGYGLSEATWEPMSACIQPDGSINPIFCSYLVENNEGQLLTHAETLSQRKKKN